MSSFMTGILVKIATSVGLWLMVQRTREAYQDPSGPHLSFMGPLVTVMLVHEIAGNLVFISMMAFFSRVSDPSIGGSYMTLLNTIANLGSKWTTSACLFMLPRVTFHACTIDAAEGFEREILAIPCAPTDAAMCTEHGGKCTVDMVSCTLIGTHLFYVSVSDVHCHSFFVHLLFRMATLYKSGLRCVLASPGCCCSGIASANCSLCPTRTGWLAPAPGAKRAGNTRGNYHVRGL